MTVTSEVVALCIAIVSLKPEDKPVRAPPPLSAALYWTLCELGFMSGPALLSEL